MTRLAPTLQARPITSPAILPRFTFHEDRHSHATWLTEDGLPPAAPTTT
ncbi:hypothetical protein [Actinokineospora globicatena]|nr:hypothetical protein [Actinokineospora globicatena]